MYSKVVNIPRPVLSIDVFPAEALDISNTFNPDETPVEEIEVKEMIQLSPEDLEREIELAHQRGYEEGELAGFQKCEQEIKPKIDLFHEIVKTMEEQKQSYLEKSEEIMVDLAVKIAKKITMTEMKFNPDIVRKIVKKVINRILDDDEVIIYLHPDDVPHLNEYRTELLESNPQVKKIKIEADASLEAGGCLVETKNGMLDSRLDEMFNEIERALLKHVQS